MRWLRAWRMRLLALLRRDALDDEVDRELRFHLDQQIAEHLERGMSPDEARRRAHVAFGNVPLVREDARAVWRWGWLDTTIRDVRHAGRSLRRRPVPACAIILTIAFAVGVSTALFSVFEAVLLRPLPYRDAERLVLASRLFPEGSPARVTTADVTDWQERSRLFEDLASIRVEGPWGNGSRGETAGPRVDAPGLRFGNWPSTPAPAAPTAERGVAVRTPVSPTAV